MSDPLSVHDLLYAASELSDTTKSARQETSLVHQRLRLVMRDSRSSVRALIEDRVIAPIKAKTDAVITTTATPSSVDGDVSVEPVTCDMLVRHGLTLDTLVAKDATLTGRALVVAGVVTSHVDLTRLGVRSLADYVRSVGPPAHIRKWLRLQTGADQAWRAHFLTPLNYSFDVWEVSRKLLSPYDLTAMEFSLGAHLAASPRAMYSARQDASDWLAIAPAQAWIDTKQLTSEQYNTLVGGAGGRPALVTTPVPAATPTPMPTASRLVLPRTPDWRQ